MVMMMYSQLKFLKNSHPILLNDFYIDCSSRNTSNSANKLFSGNFFDRFFADVMMACL